MRKISRSFHSVWRVTRERVPFLNLKYAAQFHHFFHIWDWENGLSIWRDVCFESPVKAIYGIWHEASCPFAYSFIMISDLSKHWSLGYPVAFCKQLIVTRYKKFRLVFADSWVDCYGSYGLVACLFILFYLFLYAFLFFAHTHVIYHIYIYNILWLPYWMEYTLTFNSSHIECYTCPPAVFFGGCTL